MSTDDTNSLKKTQQKKFISMMNSLTWYIRQDVKNQQQIFSCLNSIQQKRLFESIKEQDQELRITAIVFILYLLYKNQKILALIMKIDQLETNPSSKKVILVFKKYIIGGLSSYQLKKSQIIEILKKINTLQEREDVLCWSINIKTKKVQYINFEQIKGEKLPNTFLYDSQIIDPKENIIGIFTFSNQSLSSSKISIKNLHTSSKGSYLQRHKTARY